MKLQSLVSKVYLLHIDYSKDSKSVLLSLSIDGINKTYTAIPEDINGIPLMRSSDELSELLMSLMPIEPSIYKKLYSVIWDYIKGKSVVLPIKLV